MLGKQIKLRALEPEDLTFLYSVENEVNNWRLSETKIPFSKYLLKTYIEESGLSIEKVGQFRFVVEELESEYSVGVIDLFDFDTINRRLSIGVLINAEYQNKGYASEALELIEDYVANILNVHQIYCDVQADNSRSISFFKKNKYQVSGLKKDWILSKDVYSDVILFQKIL